MTASMQPKATKKGVHPSWAMQKIQVRVSGEMMRRLKHACIEKDMSLQDLGLVLFSNWLDDYEKEKA